MSVFSEKLSQLTNEKELKIYQLAERCGLDRSTVYKYLRGTRPVNSLELANAFAEALQLDPTQADELIAAYKISRMGDENYCRRKKVLEFFNSFCPGLQTEAPAPLIVPPAAQAAFLPAGCQVYEGEERINAVVQAALSAELGKPEGIVQIIAQPEYQFLFQVLDAATAADGCNMQHVLCLENTNTADAALYNLDCLQTVTKLLLSQIGYTPFYFYDSVSAHFRNHMLLPYLIVTSACAIQISYDLRRVVYHTDKKQVHFFQRAFSDALKRTAPMIRRLHNISDSLGFYLSQYTKSGQPLGICNAEPCLVPHLNRAVLERYTGPIEHRAELLELVTRYISMQRKEGFRSKNKTTEYFSAEGVDYFCRTGHIWQIPAFVMAPLEPADRYELLCRFCDSRTATNTFLMKDDAPLSLGKLEAVVWGDGGTSFVYEHSPDQYTAFFLSEKSLSFCFADFFAYIHENEMAYSNEESMRYIKEKMDELK